MDGRPIGGFVDSDFLFLSVLCSCRQSVTLVDNTLFPLFFSSSKILFALGFGGLFPVLSRPAFLHILFLFGLVLFAQRSIFHSQFRRVEYRYSTHPGIRSAATYPKHKSFEKNIPAQSQEGNRFRIGVGDLNCVLRWAATVTAVVGAAEKNST